jgi:predicted PurR-regulated permease PerM
MKTITQSPFLNPLLAAISGALIIALLVTQKTLLVPIVLGLMFAFLILPPVRKLERLGFPRIFAITLMILLMVIIVVSIGMLLYVAGSQFISSVPQYKTSITTNTIAAQQFIERATTIPVETQKLWFSENVNVLELATRNIGNIANGISNVVTTLGLTFIYAFFILYYRNKVMTFFRKLLGQADELIILATLKKLVQIVPRYLSGVSWVVIILTLVNSIGFWIIGVPNPIFFGALSALLNIIPYVGPVIGFGSVALFSFATVGPGVALGAIILFVIVQFLENNFLTPHIAGGTININPLTAIVGIIIGASIWGVIGMIIALPLLGMIKVITDSIPKLEPWGYLIGDEGTEDHALSWSTIKRIFKRNKKLV